VWPPLSRLAPSPSAVILARNAAVPARLAGCRGESHGCRGCWWGGGGGGFARPLFARCTAFALSSQNGPNLWLQRRSCPACCGVGLASVPTWRCPLSTAVRSCKSLRSHSRESRPSRVRRRRSPLSHLCWSRRWLVREGSHAWSQRHSCPARCGVGLGRVLGRWGGPYKHTEMGVGPSLRLRPTVLEGGSLRAARRRASSWGRSKRGSVKQLMLSIKQPAAAALLGVLGEREAAGVVPSSCAPLQAAPIKQLCAARDADHALTPRLGAAASGGADR
jgi:hypothetical protein